MKTIYLLLLFPFLICGMCDKDKPEDSPAPPPNSVNQSDYWGCWVQYENNPNYHDLLLSENPNGKHWYQLGNNCLPLNGMQKMAAGIFRNDTLIFPFNAAGKEYEEWAFITNDTLFYGGYIANPKPADKYVKN